MLRLHHAPDTAATILRLAAREAGLALDLRPAGPTGDALGGASGDTLVSPGTIPLLETPQGPVSETGAALLWLTETQGLGPAPGSALRPAFLTWLFFLSGGLHADLARLIRPWHHVGPEGEAGLITLTAARILTGLGRIEAAMRQTPALFPPLGPLSAYLVMLARWAAQYPAQHPPWFRLDAFPDLAAHAALAEDRPAARSIAEQEGLGPRPFTAPPPAPVPQR